MCIFNFSKIPRVANCCFFFDMNAGGTLLSLFGIVTGFAYVARAFYVLYSVPRYEIAQDDDDVMNDNDDLIW